MAKVVLISGASSGFGALTAHTLADAGHTVFAGMRDVAGRNAAAAAEAARYSRERGVDLRAVELDVSSDSSVEQAVKSVLADVRRLDVLVHNAGHMVTGPAEAFTPEQLAALYDTNVLGAHRINRAALPHLRATGDGLLVWVGSSSTRGGTPPYLTPYFAAKAGMDALAAGTALEVARFGIETTIVVPGSFTHGTNHYSHAGRPADAAVVDEYEARYPGLLDDVGRRMAEIEPPDADVSEVARAIATVVDTPKGRRPFRVHIIPTDDGAGVVNAVADHMREEFLRRIGLADLLHPANS
jgi:NAD(P)-dependent dehydrogenase (short-subunit alcohol dehydrogenase family)